MEIYLKKMGNLCKWLCFFLLSLNVSSFAFSQTYTPFADTNAVWKVIYYDYSIPGFIGELYYYKLMNDTIIQGNLYKQVYKKTYVLSGSIVNNPWHFHGALRQDTIQKKVYAFLPLMGFDALLYDYDLHLGDTLPQSIINPGSTIQLVDSIDSLQTLDGVWRKTYHIYPGNCNNDAKLIEGIGANFGLFEEMGCGIGSYTSLKCYSVDSNTVLDLGDCSIPLQITEYQNDPDKIIFLTDGKNYLLRCNEPIQQISIYSIQGLQIRNINFNNNANNYYYLDLINYDRNILLIKIVHKSYSTYHKIIN